jgi:DNA-binding HxlR family transcriptional regulator
MSRPTYAELGDACATAHAMELIGARWSYPIIRELMLGPKRFGELLSSVRGITPAVLSSRIRELTAVGLVEPTHEHTTLVSGVYDLTPWARDLAPILRQLGRWAQSSPVRVEVGGLTPDAVVQAMITMADGIRPSRSLRVQLSLSDERVHADVHHTYLVRWTRSGLSVERGNAPPVPGTVHCDSSAWGRVLFAGLPLKKSGATVTGDQTAVDALISTFHDGLST